MSYRRYGTRTSFKGVDPLTSPQYEDLWRVSRCLHICDVEDAQQQGMLVLQPIRNSRTLGHSTRVLWFAPTQSMDQHNFYGNVSYVISWQTVLNKMGPHLCLIDQAIYGDHAYTRILLTKKNYDVLLQKVDLHSEGSAIIKRSNKYLHASKCYCKNGSGVHELQIGIEATEEDARWLYSHCTVMANNHTKANAPMHRQITGNGKIKKYAPFKCFLYNSTLYSQCPNPDSPGQTEATLSSMNITFSSSLPPKKNVDSDKEIINYSNLLYPQNGIGARTPSASAQTGRIKPQIRDGQSQPVALVTPCVRQPKANPSSSCVNNDLGFSDRSSNAYACAYWNRANGSYVEVLAKPRQSAEEGFDNVDRAMGLDRANKLPPIARNAGAPTALSGHHGRRIGQHNRDVLPGTGSACNWQPSQTPSLPVPTLVHSWDRSDMMISRSSSSTPVETYYWRPIAWEDNCDRPEGSFTERLRRWFICSCRSLLKIYKKMSKKTVLCYCLCFMACRMVSIKENPSTTPHPDVFLHMDSANVKERLQNDLLRLNTFM